MATIRPLVGVAVGRNVLPDPKLLTAVMDPRGATVTDTHGTTFGPNGTGYFRRNIISPNTSSPMTMVLSGSGRNGIPVSPGQAWTVSWWARRFGTGGPFARADLQWYDASGAALSVNSGAGFTPGAGWVRYSQVNTAPVGAAFVQPRLQWSGTAVVGQDLDFADAQFELGTLSEFTDNTTIKPALVLDYGYDRGSRNVVLEPLGSGYPTVFLRPAQSRSGTLSMLFKRRADARAAEDLLGAADRFHFQEPAIGEDWHFIVTGRIAVVEVPGTNHWTVSAEFREVEPL